MRLYFFYRRIRHFLSAQNRHGVHSPFVYDFNEQVLNQYRLNETKDDLFSVPFASPDQSTLLKATARYYCCHLIWGGHIAAGPQDHIATLYVFPSAAEVSLDVTDKDIIAVTGIDETSAHRKAWEALCRDEKVKLSLELFNTGLLLFRDEFKVKQHFRLRHRL